MNKEIANAWVKALRSGQYPQATGHLKTGSGYCCLGVLCEVIGAKFLPNPEYSPDDSPGKPIRSRAPFVVEFQGKTLAPTDVLPSEIAEAAKMNSCGGHFLFDDEPVEYYPFASEELTELNDDGIGFDRIADVIERYYDKL